MKPTFLILDDDEVFSATLARSLTRRGFDTTVAHTGEQALTAVARDFDMPNGIAFSPDERRLYVADSGQPHHIRVFDVQPGGTLANGRVFCEIDKGVPDGIRCDADGRVWSSAGDGLHIFAPDGKLIGKVLVSETPANLCFGGTDGRTLFITAQKSLYALPVRVRGAH